MYQPSKWWLGLALPAVLWGAANVLSDTKIEQDLATKALAAFPWAKPVVSGRDATISGIAPSEEAKSKALTTIDAIPGVRMVRAPGLEVLAEAKPYKWQAVRDGSKITLTGYYPDAKTHQDILDAAKKLLPNVQIVDEMKLARGVPAGFASAVAFGLGQIGSLANGTASLDDLKYSITGAAPTSAIYTSEIAKVKALPQGLTLTTAAISPPVQKPYNWQALREGNAVTLSGFVPSDIARNKNIDAVKAAIAGVVVTDKQVIAGGEPAGFESMAGYGIAQLGKLLKGTASLDDKAYSLIGEAVSIPVSESSLAATKTLPVGFTLGKAIVTAPAPVAVPVVLTPPVVIAPPPVVVAPPPPPVVVVPDIKAKQVDICRTEFTQELKDSSIYFDTDKDTIRQVSYAVLDRLIEVAKKCPDVNVEIGAHTDADGAAVYNQDLSERRAQAVLSYMKVRVDTTKYSSVGFGETKPIASNDTDEGKQKNRRVEFIVK
jgi:OmpA-OmpF porin, OOP family